MDLALKYYVSRKSTATHFIDNKESKFLHLGRQKFSRSLDVIFVGNSLTKEHVSTKAFRDLGWSVYNFGISGRTLADYPSMVSYALTREPKLVAVLLNVHDLVNEPHTEFTHLEDFLSQWRAGLPVSKLAASFGNFLLANHALHYYREPIYLNIVSYLRHFLPGPPVGGAEQNRRDEIARQQSAEIDCDVFKRTAYGINVVVTCGNGDGALLGKYRPTEDPMPDVPVGSALNDHALNLLKVLVGDIQKKTRAVVVIVPVLEKVPPVDLEQVRARIGAPVLDLRGATLSMDDWGDGGHFNIFGRQKYSLILEKELRPLLEGAGTRPASTR